MVDMPRKGPSTLPASNARPFLDAPSVWVSCTSFDACMYANDSQLSVNLLQTSSTQTTAPSNFV